MSLLALFCHKVSAGLATQGKCLMGCFYGIKPDLIANDQVGLITLIESPEDHFTFTQGLAGRPSTVVC